MGARIPDLENLIAAGVNPKTGLPLRFDCGKIKTAFKLALRIKEESEFVNRFKWYNLPLDITGEELERLLYYKGNLCFFYAKELERFFVAPYALNGTIDAYGRYTTIKPVPMTSGKTDKNKSIADVFAGLTLNVLYEIPNIDEMDDEKIVDLFENSAVIIRDYTNQMSQTNLPRQQINDQILDLLSDQIAFMKTRLILGTGVKGVRVNDADQENSVLVAGQRVKDAAANGDAYVPIVGNIEFQELTDGNSAAAAEYMQAYQSIENLRKELIGLPSSGVFEKKAHTLQSEQDMNGTNVDLVLVDGLNQRQNACMLINAVWGIGMWCEVSESISIADTNGDGVVYDENSDTVNVTEGEQNNE